jgi:hypothetical protein
MRHRRSGIEIWAEVGNCVAEWEFKMRHANYRDVSVELPSSLGLAEAKAQRSFLRQDKQKCPSCLSVNLGH